MVVGELVTDIKGKPIYRWGVIMGKVVTINLDNNTAYQVLQIDTENPKVLKGAGQGGHPTVWQKTD